MPMGSLRFRNTLVYWYIYDLGMLKSTLINIPKYSNFGIYERAQEHTLFWYVHDD